MLARADWNTVRLIPWVEKTAMVMCDLFDVDYAASSIEVAPRTILQRQVEAAAAMGFLPMVASEIEFYLFQRHLRRGSRQGLPRPAAALAVARGLPHPPDHQGRVHPRRDPPRARGRRACRSSSARARPAGASTRSTSTTPPPSRWPTATASTRPPRRRSPTSTAGRSASWPSTTSTTPARRATSTRACGASTARRRVFDDHHGPHGMSETFQHYLAGLIATAREFSLLWAPTINSYKRFQLGFVGAHRRRLGHRQPHARLPQGRPRQGHPGRVPHPRQRREQLLRLRRHHRRRPVRHPQQAGARRAVHRATATRPTDIAAHPVEHRRGHRAVGAQRRSPASASATTCTTTSSPWPRPSGWRSTRPSPTGSCAATGSASSVSTTAGS